MRWVSGSSSITKSIEILRKLADRLRIAELNEFDDVVPLMFSHTTF